LLKEPDDKKDGVLIYMSAPERSPGRVINRAGESKLSPAGKAELGRLEP
jgi:hypothetical protein